MIEELGLRLSAAGVVETTSGVTLTGKAIEDLGKKADAAAPAIARTGKTAKETAAAMRLLPAQITDITTSLASGQAAWLVAIQQGGQIKDSFGGIGPTMQLAASAISPVTLALGGAAVAAGALTTAWVLGAREGQAYTQSIVMSGNAAGVTTGQLGDMARAQAAVVGTQRQAADAIAQLVASGQVGAGGLRQFAETAVRMERTVGQSVEDTVKTFADLGRAPLQASIRLNESMNYLTLGTYNHIKALVEQKKMGEAAAVAQQAYAEAMKPRLAELEGNVGTLQKAWRGLGDFASSAWDRMLGIGREASVSDKIKSIGEQIDALDSRKSTNPGLTAQRRAALVEQLAAQRELQRLQERGASIQASEAARVKNTIAADQDKKKSIREVRDAHDALGEAIERRLALEQAEEAGGAKLSEADRYRVETLAQIAQKQRDIGIIAAEVWRTETERVAVLIEANQARRDSAKEEEEIHKRFLADRAQATQAAENGVSQILKENEALAEETAQIGLNSDAMYLRKQALLADAIATKQAALARIDGLPAYTEEATAIEQQIALLRDRRALLGENYAKASAEAEAKAGQERTDAIASSIETGVLDGFRDGRKASEVFLREIQAQFLRTVLKMPIQLLAQSGSDLFAKLVGGVAGLFSPAGLTTGDFSRMDRLVGVGAHSGMGPGDAPTFRRSLPASTWHGAPRAHAGIGPGELPAIIKGDESVLTKGQMKALAPVSDIRGGNVVNLTYAPQIDARTDKAEIMGLLARTARAMQADLLDKMNRRQV